MLVSKVRNPFSMFIFIGVRTLMHGLQPNRRQLFGVSWWKRAQEMIWIRVRFIENAKSTQYAILLIIKCSCSLFCCVLWIENELNIQSTSILCHWICVYIVCKSSYMNYVIEYPSLRNIWLLYNVIVLILFTLKIQLTNNSIPGEKPSTSWNVFAFNGLKLPRSPAFSLSLPLCLKTFPFLIRLSRIYEPYFAVRSFRFHSDFHLYFSFSNVNKIESEWNEMMTITIKVSQSE